MNKTIQKVIENLEKEYKDDPEALNIIDQAKMDCEYYEKTDQTDKVEAHIRNLEAFFADWY